MHICECRGQDFLHFVNCEQLGVKLGPGKEGNRMAAASVPAYLPHAYTHTRALDRTRSHSRPHNRPGAWDAERWSALVRAGGAGGGVSGLRCDHFRPQPGLALQAAEKAWRQPGTHGNTDQIRMGSGSRVYDRMSTYYYLDTYLLPTYLYYHSTIERRGCVLIIPARFGLRYAAAAQYAMFPSQSSTAAAKLHAMIAQPRESIRTGGLS